MLFSTYVLVRQCDFNLNGYDLNLKVQDRLSK